MLRRHKSNVCSSCSSSRGSSGRGSSSKGNYIDNDDNNRRRYSHVYLTLRAWKVNKTKCRICLST